MKPERKRAPGGGRKPGTAKFTARIIVRLTPDLLEWVKSQGGSAWVRELIEREKSGDRP
jgi:hypothetical protein